MIGAEIIPVQTISVVLLGAAVVYFLLLWLLKPGEQAGGSGSSQSTIGPQSPNFGAVHGNVHITHATPAETQPRKSPYGEFDATKEESDELVQSMQDKLP